MRNKRLWVLLSVCVALALVVANSALTQFQGPGRGGRGDRGGRGGMGGGGGRMGGRMNPDMLFNMMSQGKDYIEIATLRMGRDQAEAYAKRKGITNGRLTKEQFTEYMQERFAQRQAERGGAPGGATSADPAKDAFDRLDRNRDGALADDEIPGSMRSDLSKWDNNRDGKIQLDEYRAFYKANAPAESARSSSSLTITQQNSLEELDKRATVYRAGQLPPELQRTWFEECDTDLDGQVGLYEWKAGGYQVAEFRAMDSNGDGFVTAEEALRYVRKNGGGNTSGTAVAGAFGRGQGGRGQGGFGRNQGMGGQGGWGMGGGGWGQGGGGRRQRGGGGGGMSPGGGQGGGMGGFNRGPSASADGGFGGDRQSRTGGGGGRGRGGRGGRGQRGGGGGGMAPSWPGSP